MLAMIIGTEKRGLAVGVEAQPSGDLTWGTFDLGIFEEWDV